MKKVFQTKLKSITKVLTLVIIASLATFTGCTSYDEDITKLNGDITSLKAELKTLQDGAVASATAKITALEAEVTALKGKVTTLETSGATDAEVATAIAAAKADILNKTVSIEALNAYKLVVTDQIATATANLATKEDVATATANLATKEDVNAKIVEVNSALTKLGADATALKAEVTSAVASIATLKADVEARLAVLEGLLVIQNGKSTILDGFTAQLTAQLAKINTNTAEITSIKAELVTLKADIAKGISEDELNSKLTLVNKNLKALASAVSLNFDVLSSRLSTLTYIPELFVNGIEAMNFSPLLSVCQTITPSVTVAYHMSPSFITAADIETNNMSFAVIASENMQFVQGLGKANAAATAVKANFVKIEGGKLYVAVAIEDFNALFAGNVTGGLIEKFKMIALQVPLSEKAVKENKLEFDNNGNLVTVGDTEFPADRVVTSQYVRLFNKEIVAQTDVYLAKNSLTFPKLPQTVAAAKALSVAGVDAATTTDPLVITLPYGESINLVDYVKAVYAGSVFDTDKYGLKFKFDLLDDTQAEAAIVYNRGGNNTDQQQFIAITDAAKGTINAKVFTQAEIAAAQGRTPIVRVSMYNDQDPTCEVLESFVKIYIAERPLPTPITVTFDVASSVGPCADAVAVLTVQQMNEQIYNKVGMSKEEFHAAYPSAGFSYTGDGVVAELYSPDNQTTDSYLLNWTLTASQIWTKLMTTDPAAFAATAVYVPTMSTVYPKLNIKFTRSFTKPAGLNITTAQMITNYWYDNYTYVKHNIVVPAVGETNNALALFENNINQAFEQNADKSLKALANYEYYFLTTQPKHVDGTVNGTTLTVSSDGKQLLNGSDVVATINPFAAGVGDVLVLNKSSVTAKRLLNYGKEFLTARIAIRSIYCASLPQYKMPVTVNGKAYFDVKFVRPINATPNPTEFFIDGKNFGEVNTYLEIAKLVNLADWRNGTDYVSTFAKYDNYYKYYGVTNITADVANITTDLNQAAGVRVPKSNYPDLRVAYAPFVAGVSPTAQYGYITYQNTGNTLGIAFKLYIPVTIEYAWGSIVTTEIAVDVQKTVGPSGVKAKK